MSNGCEEITDRKFINHAKVIDIDFEKRIVRIDNSEDHDMSDLIDVKVLLEDSYMLEYFKVCINNNILVNLEIDINNNELINGYIDVCIEKGDEDKEYRIILNVEVEGIPNIIEININEDDRLVGLFNKTIKNEETLGVSLFYDYVSKKWGIKSIRFRIK